MPLASVPAQRPGSKRARVHCPGEGLGQMFAAEMASAFSEVSRPAALR